MKNKKCPNCNNNLTFIYKNKVSLEKQKELDKNNIDYVVGFILEFGDDRDPKYICKTCRKEFDKNLSELQLIDCDLVEDYTIHKHECKNYELLKSKYRIIDKLEVCKNCINNKN